MKGDCNALDSIVFKFGLVLFFALDAFAPSLADEEFPAGASIGRISMSITAVKELLCITLSALSVTFWRLLDDNETADIEVGGLMSVP